MDEFGWRTIAGGSDSRLGPRRCSFDCLAVTAPALRSGTDSPLNTRPAAPGLDAADRGVLNGSEGERLAVAARCSQRGRARPKR